MALSSRILTLSWHLEEKDSDSEVCFQNCQYDGCHTPGWTVASRCDSTLKTCFHGDYDAQCSGIRDSGTYEGMEDRNGTATFCLEIFGIPVKMSVCPPPPEEEKEGLDLVDERGEVDDFSMMTAIDSLRSSTQSYIRNSALFVAMAAVAATLTMAS